MNAVATTNGNTITVEGFAYFWGLLVFSATPATSMTWQNKVTLLTSPITTQTVFCGASGAALFQGQYNLSMAGGTGWQWGVTGGKAGALGSNQAVAYADAPNPWPAKAYAFTIDVTSVVAGSGTVSMHLYACTI